MDFLLENPVILAMAILVLLLVLSIPIGILQQRRSEKAGDAPPTELQQRSAFMGAGFDLAILLLGILVVGAIILSLIDAFK